MDIALAAARLALGILSSEEAIAAASEAIDRGLLSESLGQLLIAQSDWPEVEPLFRKALSELEIAVPTRKDALCSIISHEFVRQYGTSSIPWEDDDSGLFGRAAVLLSGMGANPNATPEQRLAWATQVAQGYGELELPEEVLDRLSPEERSEYDRIPERVFFETNAQELQGHDAGELHVRTPEELRAFAENFQVYHLVARKGLLAQLRRLVHHPHCDLGTAAMVYWRVARFTNIRYLREPEDEEANEGV